MPEMRSESFAMRFFRVIGMDSVAWSLRRLHVPVNRKALVLEVGSGGNPYPRANVLLDAYEATRERHWAPLVADRPTVLGFVERLPFKTGAFDFVIASHVLEHSTDPARFLKELQRVAKGGYIEVPDAFLERINPYRDHRLEITQRSGALIVRKKKAWNADPDLMALYEDRVKNILTKELLPSRPFAFHVRHFWSNNISYQIVNDYERADWEPAPSESLEKGSPERPVAQLKGALLKLLRRVLSQQRRNLAINLTDILACPSCGHESLASALGNLHCGRCGALYPIVGGIPRMYPVKESQG